VRGIGLITVTHVRVSGDLRHARALFTVHGMHPVELERVRQGLDHASGYFRRAIAKRLRTKVSPTVTFEVDHVFEQAERVEKLLHEVEAQHEHEHVDEHEHEQADEHEHEHEHADVEDGDDDEDGGDGR
jgi:ribosome-binding factor A